MNERIKELIEQAYVEVPHERDWDAMSIVFNKEKFAELIVKECISMAKGFEFAVGCDGLSDAIKDHFGV